MKSETDKLKERISGILSRYFSMVFKKAGLFWDELAVAEMAELTKAIDNLIQARLVHAAPVAPLDEEDELDDILDDIPDDDLFEGDAPSWF
jgi:hypothetical protein